MKKYLLIILSLSFNIILANDVIVEQANNNPLPVFSIETVFNVIESGKYDLNNIMLVAENGMLTNDVYIKEKSIDIYRYLLRSDENKKNKILLEKALAAAKIGAFYDIIFGSIRGSALHLFEVLVKIGVGLDDAVAAAEFTIFKRNGFHYRNRALDLFVALFKKGKAFDQAFNLVEKGIFIENSFVIRRTLELFDELIKYNGKNLMANLDSFNRVLKIFDNAFNYSDSYTISRYSEILLDVAKMKNKAGKFSQELINKSLDKCKIILSTYDLNDKSKFEKIQKELIKYA
jgi:hypothetical protein